MWAQLGLAALSGLGGLFSKPKPIATTQDQNSSFDQSMRPVYDPNVLELRNRLVNQYLGGLEDEGDYWSGYTRQGMGNLAQAGSSAQNYIQNLLAARGIRGGMAGSAMAMPVVNQQMQQANFLNSIPQLVDQRRREILGQTGNFLASLPLGQQSTGTSQSHSTSTQMGGQSGGVGNFLGGMVPSLAWTYGLSQQKTPTPTTTTGGINPNYKLPG